jgi:hypothetical protein
MKEHPKEIEAKTALAWLAAGAIKLTEEGEENSYFENEFGHRFFCKDLPESN